MVKNDNDIAVSVITPVYNAEKYLTECLNSVLSQTLNNIELILVNDGSSDSSVRIIKDYQKHDPRVKLIEQNNQGSGAARNKAIKHAKGEFIVFMDSDDLYPSDTTLEDLYTAAVKNKVLISGGSFSSFSLNNSKETVVTSWDDPFLSGYTFNKAEIILYSDYQFDYGYHRFMYNREFIVRNKLFFPGYIRFQDPPFLVKALSVAKKFYAIPEVTYKYREGHKEIIFDAKKMSGVIQGTKDNIKIAIENNFSYLLKLATYRLLDHMQYFRDVDRIEYIADLMSIYSTISIQDKIPLDETNKLRQYLEDVIFIQKEQLKHENADLNRRLEETRAEVNRLDDEINSLINSKSWKLTQPMRSVRGVIRRVQKILTR